MWPVHATLAGLAFFPWASGALIVSDAALEATQFSAVPAASLVLPGPNGSGFDGYLYAIARNGDTLINELVKFDAAGTELARSILAVDAAEPTLGTGSYAGRIFLSEFGLPDAAPDGVYELQPDGSVTLYSNLGGGNPDSHGIVFGDGGSFGDSIYVSNPSSGTIDARADTAIVRLNGDGSIASTLVSDSAGPFFAALTPAGSKADYGDYIYYSVLTANRVMRVDAAGVATTFATLDPDDRPFALAFSPDGALGNSLYVLVNNLASSAARRLVRILPDGTVETVATAVRGTKMAFDPVSMDLFIADESGGIVRIGAPSCTDQGPGSVQFTSSSRNVGEGDGVVAFYVSRSCGTAGEVTVDYLLTAGTAVPTDDYLHPPGSEAPQTDTGTLVFSDGVDLQSIAVEIVNDDLLDGAKDFRIELLTATGGAVLGDTTGLAVTIDDDDTGTDLELVSLTFEPVNSGLDFVGLTAGFNELEYRYRLKATIRNNGPAPIENFSLELLIPKDHLAGYGQKPGSSCEVVTVDPPDPVYVHVVCTGLSLGVGDGEIVLPSDDAPLYVGYAEVVPRNTGYTYSATVRALGASVPDTNSANDSKSATVVPRAGSTSKSKSGGGALSPGLLGILGVLTLLHWRRRRSSALAKGKRPA
jgi:hypothetical protein